MNFHGIIFFIEESFASERNLIAYWNFLLTFEEISNRKKKMKENGVKLQGIFLLSKSSQVFYVNITEMVIIFISRDIHIASAP